MVLRRILAFGMVLGLFFSVSGCIQPDTAEIAQKISTQTVRRGDLQIGLYADGRIDVPLNQLSFSVSGPILSVLAKPGQIVQAGDLLAVLDDSLLQQAFFKAERDYEKSKSAYDEAVRNRSYTLQVEKIKLDALWQKTRTPFDSTLEQAEIETARLLVDTRQSALNEEIEKYDQLEEAEATSEVLASAEKSVDSAQASLDSAMASLAKLEDSLSSALAKHASDIENAKTEYTLQKLKYENLQASELTIINAEQSVAAAADALSEAKMAFESARLYAPEQGTIVQVNYAAGDLFTAKSSGDASGSLADSSAFLIYTDSETTLVTANISEQDISDIVTGQAMRISVDALNLENLPGIVTQVSLLPRIDNSGIVTYAVVGQLEQTDPRIRAGMNTFMTFLKKEKKNVLLVANRAIYVEAGQQYVDVQLEDGSIDKREVVCGLTNGTQSEVIEGLAEGETVVTGGVRP